jgi:gas vesicle protein
VRRGLLIGILIGVLTAVGGTLLARDGFRLRTIDAGIRKEQTTIRTALEEKKKIREDIERLRTQLREIPDSLSGERTGLLMGSSFDIAKREGALDQDALRARRRMRDLEATRETIAASLRRRAVVVAILEALLLAGAIVVGRYAARGG